MAIPDTSSWGQPDQGIRLKQVIARAGRRPAGRREGGAAGEAEDAPPAPGAGEDAGGLPLVPGAGEDAAERARQVLRGIQTTDWFVGRAAAGLAEAPRPRVLAPRGAVIDPDAPDFEFPIVSKLDCWADDVPELYERSKAEQWDATRDIPWHLLPDLPEDVEQAICQLMTFLIENEYVALYLPAKFIPRIAPHYGEVALLLATQVKDEARHVEVYTKRALANGCGLQYVSATTQWALKSLLEQENYLRASFLLHVLGEGTFMELLKFIEEHAPDPVTKEILRRTRQDEARHVGYGVSHVRYLLQQEPKVRDELVAAAEERASFLKEVSGANPFVQRALAVLAGGGSKPQQLVQGVQKVRELYRQMHHLRVRRMMLAGFDAKTAVHLSELHGGAVQTFM
jgi:hypothetical protein